jgi:sporulation protein YlmC with PRC-barrel domain
MPARVDAVAVSELLRKLLHDEHGERVATLRDFIVDVREGRVLYLRDADTDIRSCVRLCGARARRH